MSEPAPVAEPASAPVAAQPAFAPPPAAPAAAPVAPTPTAEASGSISIPVPPAPPAPQPRTDHTHDGLYVRVSTGLAATSVLRDPKGSTGTVDTTSSGLDMALLIGGTPSPGLTVGGALFADLATDDKGKVDGVEATDPINSTLTLIGPFVDGFFKPRGGWHLGASLGLATLKVDGSKSTGGLGAAAFGGYDAWVGDDWSLGVEGCLTGARTSKKDEGTGNATSATLSVTVLYH